MSSAKKLSPYSFDAGRIARLLTRPNIGYAPPTGPHDDVFPEEGYVILRGAASKQDCQDIIKEYEAFEQWRDDKNCQVRDENGRNYRLVNFHLVSEKLRAIGLNGDAHDLTGRFFGQKSLVYTSLYFKHGSQQRPHIDTPFFWTQPMNMFCGVWLALEDVSPDAGPVIYYPGSHKYFSDPAKLKRYHDAAEGDVQRMFGLMESDIRDAIQPAFAEIKAGDIFIWHPGLMHGGSPAKVPGLTRHSVVFHFAPLGVNVRDHKKFLQPFVNWPKYGVVEQAGRYYARGSLPAIMI